MLAIKNKEGKFLTRELGYISWASEHCHKDMFETEQDAKALIDGCFLRLAELSIIDVSYEIFNSDTRTLLRKLYAFTTNANKRQFATIFPNMSSHLWLKYSSYFGKDVVAFWRSLDSENERIFLIYVNQIEL